MSFLNKTQRIAYRVQSTVKKLINSLNAERCPLNAKSGFTLIELMSALAIFSILTLTLYIVFDRANKIWRHGEISTEQYENARTALDMMAREITSAIIATGGPTSFSSSPIYRPYLWSVYGSAAPDYDRDKIYFIFNRGNALYEVGYYIDEGDPSTAEDNTLKRAYTSAANTDFDISSLDEFGPTEDVAFKITDLNFKFIYKNNEGIYQIIKDELEPPNRAWDTRMPYHTGLTPGPTTSTDDDGRLPDFIEISIRMFDKNTWEIHGGAPPKNYRKEFKVMIPMNQRSLRNE